jgi:hypothetical protein
VNLKILSLIKLLHICYLSREDSAFASVCDENRKLLANVSIPFTVNEADYGMGTSYTNRFNGSFNSNGFLYCSAVDVSQSVRDKYEHFPAFLGFKVSPIEFKGKINCIGLLTLKASKFKYSLAGANLPQQFSGSIDENGNVILFLTDKDWEIVGNHYASKLIADPFKTDNEKRKRFQKNAQYIYEKMMEVRKSV